MRANWGWVGRGLTAVSILLMAAACGPAVTPTPTASPLPSPTPSPPALTPTADASDPLVVTLTLWVPEVFSPYQEDPAGVLLAQRLNSFSGTYPNLQVETIVKKAHGRGGLLDFMRTAQAAAPSVLPDLVILDASELVLATQAELLRPLDGLLPEERAADQFPFAAQLGDVDGQTMGVVVAAELEHVVYDPALFSRPPLTWTDVISAPAPFAFPAAGRDGGVNDATLIQYLTADGHVVDGEGNPALEEGPLRQVLTFYDQAVASGVISPTVVLALDDVEAAWELYQEGQTGMAVVNSRSFQLRPEETLAAAGPIPTRNGDVVTFAEGWAMVMVTSDPQRQQQAAILLDWLVAPSFLGPWARAEGYLPGTLSGLQAWTATEEERAMLEALLEGARPPVAPALRAAIGPSLQTAVEMVLRGRRTPANAAAEASRAVGP
ncbi:MAG: extracellular solute-binding protein [Anaerolineae bacterium]|jgi:ABC-type glycerol-3-phosphate transport system substrate-binding protein